MRYLRKPTGPWVVLYEKDPQKALTLAKKKPRFLRRLVMTFF